jgi:cytoskeleton-associated protein 5
VQTSLTNIIPDLDGALKSKNPQVKEGTLKFLGRCFTSATSPIQPAQVKPMAELLAILLEDGFEGARNEAATCLGCLMKMVGERPLNATMDTLQDMRKAKVKEAFENAVVKCKAAAPSRAPAAPVKKGAQKVPLPDELEAPSVAKPAPKPSAKPVV